MMGVYLLDGQVIISERYESIQALVKDIGDSYIFIDIRDDTGADTRLLRGVDY